MFAITRLRITHPNIKTFTKVLSKQICTSNALFKNSMEHLKVNINGEDLEFPYVWLRDNCQCEKCHHNLAKGRIIDWSQFDPNIVPKEVTKLAKNLEVTWPDGHASTFNYDWLKFRSFSPENQKTYTETIYKPTKIAWQGKDFENICSRHDYSKILSSDVALYDWLEKLSVYGVAIIENTPHSETALGAIIAKIGFTKQTHYGVKYIVQNVPNPSNIAYLSSKLQLHTDLAYYEYCPGTNMLHFLVQTKSQGGENLLSDCHYVANYMKENHPEEYRLLTQVEVEWNDIGIENGNEFFKLYRSPLVVLNKQGEIIRINFSVAHRGSHFPGPIEEVVPWYKAYCILFELNNKFAAKFKSKSGNILTFDNIRVVHGRNAYEDDEGNVRKLIGAYVDWDEIYSRLRCLRVKLKNDKGIL